MVLDTPDTKLTNLHVTEVKIQQITDLPSLLTDAYQRVNIFSITHFWNLLELKSRAFRAVFRPERRPRGRRRRRRDGRRRCRRSRDNRGRRAIRRPTPSGSPEGTRLLQ